MCFDSRRLLTHAFTHPEEADADEHRRTVHWDPSAHAPARESSEPDPARCLRI
jgi:hypothetical protein